jgi:elongation factor G
MAASGKEYTTEQIRNVAVVGHGGSGKTTLVDALCFAAGTSRRKGSVEEGHALTMTTPEELDHGISLQTTPAYAEYDGSKVNLLDTPGYLDFTGDALAAVRVADSALITVGATAGVEVGTEVVWQYCEDRGIPRMFFISMMDKDHADFEKVFAEIKERLASNVVPVEMPIGAGEDFRGIINLFSQRAHLFKAGSPTGEYEEADIPEELKDKFDEWETEFF